MSDSGGMSPPTGELREADAADPVLTQKINKLFATIRPGGGSQAYTNKEIADRVGVTDSYIHYLRRGKRVNPSDRLLRNLEKCFGVERGYLDPQADPVLEGKVDRQLAMLEGLREHLPVLDRLRERGVLGEVLQECVLRLESRDADDGPRPN